MAFVIGLVTPEEAESLKRGGWELEDPPPGFETEDDEDRDGMKMVSIFVDADLSYIMKAPGIQK